MMISSSSLTFLCQRRELIAREANDRGAGDPEGEKEIIFGVLAAKVRNKAFL